MATGTDKCLGCGNQNAWMIRWVKEKFTGNKFMECNQCFDASISECPDVYFRQPYWDDNLHDQDDPNYDPEKGVFVTSKKHKAYLFKKLRVREAGDRVRGATTYDPVYARVARRNFERSLNQ
jgi:hypothetical protein